MEEAVKQPMAAPPAEEKPKKKSGLPGVFDLTGKSWAITTKYKKEWLAPVGVYLAAALIQTVLQQLLPDLVWLHVILMIIVIILGIWFTIVLTRMMYTGVMEDKMNLQEAQKGWGRVVLPMIVVSIIVGILTTIGLIIFIIPGIIVGLMYFAAQYAVIVDKKGIGESMSWSVKLTKGKRWALLGRLIGTGIVVGVIGGIAVMVVGGILGWLGGMISETWGIILGLVGMMIVIAPFIPWSTGINAMLYGALKRLETK